jgi:hypothetical protein
VWGYGGGDREWAPQAPGGCPGRPLTRARVCGGDFRWGWGGQAQRPHHRCEVHLGDRELTGVSATARDRGLERRRRRPRYSARLRSQTALPFNKSSMLLLASLSAWLSGSAAADATAAGRAAALQSLQPLLASGALDGSSDGSGGPPAAWGAISCSSQEQLFTGFNFVEGVCCHQLNESCPPGTGLPTSCRTPACAHAVSVVSSGCLPWLAQPAQAWLQSFAAQLSQVQRDCQGISTDPTTIVLSNSSEFLVSNACGRTLVGGKLENKQTWRDSVTLVAPRPFAISLAFDVLWLPDGDNLQIFDGNSTSSRKITTLSGIVLPPQNIIATDGQLHLELYTNTITNGRVQALSAVVICACADDRACGAHGSCVANRCVCTGGYTGYACADKSCTGVMCGAHGSCESRHGQAVCVCESGWTGPQCNTVDADPQCSLPYTNITDPWRSVKHNDKGPGGKVAGDVQIGTLCDDNMKATGVGGGRWYRFVGSAGDRLPTSPPGIFKCGTDGGGWLSGWDPAPGGHGAQPPVSFDTPGHYPIVTDGVQDATVCFDFGGGYSCDYYAPISMVCCDGFYLWRLSYATVASGTKYCNHAYCVTES